MTEEEIRKNPLFMVTAWVCDCAERALLREKSNGMEPDVKTWDALEVIRLYLLGRATEKELKAIESATWAFAWYSVWAAVRVALGVATASAAAVAEWAAMSSAKKGTPEREDEEAWQARRYAWLCDCKNATISIEGFFYLSKSIRCPEDARIDFGLGARK